MSRTIIGFTGKIGAGKSAAAHHLYNYGFTRVRFAGPLKAMMKTLGLSDREIDGDLKEQPCELLGGRTPRYAMQTIGTEWGREIIHPDLWINVWKHHVTTLPPHIPVVVDDVRFENEAKALRSMGGKLVRIVRPVVTAGVASIHKSEDMDFVADATVINEGTLEELFAKLDDMHILDQIDLAA